MTWVGAMSIIGRGRIMSKIRSEFQVRQRRQCLPDIQFGKLSRSGRITLHVFPHFRHLLALGETLKIFEPID